MSKFASSLTRAQLDECRRFEAANITTYSQAVKAFERGERSRIDEWRAVLAAKEGGKH